MNILFLDDDEQRQKKFRRHCPSATIVATAQECITQLEKSEWDAVFLDHDLGGETFVNSHREDCGMEVVRWLEENKQALDNIICHSLNPNARVTMVSRLTQAGYRTHNIPILNVYTSPFVEALLNEDGREDNAEES